MSLLCERQIASGLPEHLVEVIERRISCVRGHQDADVERVLVVVSGSDGEIVLAEKFRCISILRKEERGGQP